MGYYKNMMLEAMEGICDATGCEWEHLESLQEETGYSESEIVALFEEFRTKCEAGEEQMDYIEFYDFAVNSMFEWTPDHTVVTDRHGRIKRSSRRPSLTDDALSRLLAHLGGARR